MNEASKLIFLAAVISSGCSSSTPSGDTTTQSMGTNSSGSTSNASAAQIDSEHTAIGNGHYILGKTGGFYAISAESLYVANQDTNTIDHINPKTGELLSNERPSYKPDLVNYIAESNSLFVSLHSYGGIPAVGTSTIQGSIKRIDLNTGIHTTIKTGGLVQSMATLDSKIFFTILSGHSGIDEWSLRSIDSNNELTDHGNINGDLIELNPKTGDLIAVKSNIIPVSVYRYSFDSNLKVVEQQFSRDLGGVVNDIAISKDGLRLAIISDVGNGQGYSIHDIEAADITTSSGAWDTGKYPRAADFSASGDQFAASNRDSVIVFDAKGHHTIQTHDIADSWCDSGTSLILSEVLYSKDDQHIFTKLSCGYDSEKSVFFFFPKT